MRYSFEDCQLVFPGHPDNGKKISIKVDRGKIVKEFPKGGKVKTIKDVYLAPTFIDTWAHLSDPGFEYRETKRDTALQAAFSGISKVYGLPSTNPIIDDKTKVESLLRYNDGHAVHILPLPALSQNLDGESLTEMIDMASLGLRNFTDGISYRTNLIFIERCLAYLKGLDGTLHVHTNDAFELDEGQIHQSKVSTCLGLKGVPDFLESNRVKDIIARAKYYDARVHFSNISSQESVEVVKKAKKEGVKVTASVSLLNLVKEVEELMKFDENLKVNPPLRSKEDRNSLIKNVKNGVLDTVCSNHQPKSIDEKRVEFVNAEFGASTLQNFGNELLELFGLDTAIEVASIRTRDLMGLDIPSYVSGEEADLMWISENDWTFENDKVISKSVNNPLLKRKYSYRIEGILAHGNHIELSN